MNEPRGSQRDAASTIFNLPDYRVIEAIDLPGGGRRITIGSTVPPGCPRCGVIEPWMTTLVDLSTGQVLGVVDGRDSAALGSWLAARSQAWREGGEVVAIDPSAALAQGPV